MSSDPAAEKPDVQPLTDADWPPELADLLAGFAGQLNVYRTMAHHPALLRAWAPLREHIVNRSSLAKEDLEVVILRSGHNLRSQYEWSHHVQRARQIGLSDDRIRSTQGHVNAMAAGDAALCRGVDDLFQAARLNADTKQALIVTFGLAAVFDLMATVGFYSTLGFILNTFETPLDQDIKAELEAHPLAL